MLLPTPTELLKRSKTTLQNTGHHRRLVLLHAGTVALLSLLVSALNLLLQQGIDATGGLAGLDKRSVLSTAQTLLSFATAVLLPFWSLGYIAATTKLARQESPRPDDLLAGLRCFFPAMRLFLLQELIFIALGVACLNIGSLLLSLTPLGNGLYELLLPVLESGGDPYAVDPDALMNAMLPVFIGCVAVFAVIAILVLYRLRMANYILLDNPRAGARNALRQSLKMTKGNSLALFKLDLHFWWFYVAEILVTAVAYGDVLLPLLGLEINATAAYFGFYALSLALQLMLYAWQKNTVFTTYAHAYLSFLSSKDNGQLTMDN